MPSGICVRVIAGVRFLPRHVLSWRHHQWLCMNFLVSDALGRSKYQCSFSSVPFTIGESMQPLDRWRCTDRWQHGRSRSDVRLPTVPVGLLSGCTLSHGNIPWSSSPKTIGSSPTSSPVPGRPAQRIAGCTDRVEARQIQYSTYRDFGAEHVEVDARHHHLLGESGLVSCRTQRTGTATSGISRRSLVSGTGIDPSNSWNDVGGVICEPLSNPHFFSAAWLRLKTIANMPCVIHCLSSCHVDDGLWQTWIRSDRSFSSEPPMFGRRVRERESRFAILG